MDISWLAGDDIAAEELLLRDLDEKKRTLFSRVHQLEGGCSLLLLLDERPSQFLTIDDLASHLGQSQVTVESNLRLLLGLGLVQRKDAAGASFYGLDADPAQRQLVHDLFEWQHQWHLRLARLENLVDGHLHA